jgi:hypothetical protein
VIIAEQYFNKSDAWTHGLRIVASIPVHFPASKKAGTCISSNPRGQCSIALHVRLTGFRKYV